MLGEGGEGESSLWSSSTSGKLIAFQLPRAPKERQARAYAGEEKEGIRLAVSHLSKKEKERLPNAHQEGDRTFRP